MIQKRVRDKYFSESLMRGLLVIRTFDRGAPFLRMSEVANRTGLTRAAARRFLLTLQDLGYVGSDREHFFLRPRVLELGFSYFSSVNVDHIVQPFLNELAEKTQQTSSFAVLDGMDVLYVARAASKCVVRFSISIGGRSLAHTTSLGLVMLAALPAPDLKKYLVRRRAAASRGAPPDRPGVREAILKARHDGWSSVDARREEGIASIAVPIHDRIGATIAAINIMQYPGRDGRTSLARKYLGQLRETAQQISIALEASNHFTLGARHSSTWFRADGEW